MAKEKLELTHPERLKWFRNVNIIGAIGLIGAGVYLPAYQEVLMLGAIINLGEAGAAEAWRQHKLKKPAKIKAA